MDADLLSPPPIPEPSIGSVVLDRVEDAWQRLDDRWVRAGDSGRAYPWQELVDNYGPLTLLLPDDQRARNGAAVRRCGHDPDSGEPKGECPCDLEGCGRGCPCVDEDEGTAREATVIRVGRLAGSQRAARELCAEVQKGTPVVLDFRDSRTAAPSFVGALLFYATVPPDNTNPVEVVGAGPEVVEAAEAWIAQSGRVVAGTVTFR